ncbi:hypothetical protein BHE74_00055497, partial [Ensete ventricosum]
WREGQLGFLLWRHRLLRDRSKSHQLRRQRVGRRKPRQQLIFRDSGDRLTRSKSYNLSSFTLCERFVFPLF